MNTITITEESAKTMSDTQAQKALDELAQFKAAKWAGMAIGSKKRLNKEIAILTEELSSRLIARLYSEVSA